MRVIPHLETDKTELTRAPTSNVITAFGFCNKHATVWTASPFLMCHLVDGVTVSHMLLHHALLTVLCSTCSTCWGRQFHVDQALTVFYWAQFEVRVSDVLAPHLGLPILSLQITRQILVYLALQVDLLFTKLIWTLNLLHRINLITDILYQAMLAVSMLALAKLKHLLLLITLLTKKTCLLFQIPLLRDDFLNTFDAEQLSKLNL